MIRKIAITMRNIGLIVLTIVSVFVISIFVNHNMALKEEGKNLKVIGNLVDIGGEKINVYTEGEGKKTLVFLSDSNSVSPVLEFKPLYTKLSDKFKIVVVERSGTGFSESKGSKNIEEISKDIENALKKAKIKGPYILVGHGTGGLYAMDFAKKHEKDVEAIIGIDMVTLKACENYKVNFLDLKFQQIISKIGGKRLDGDKGVFKDIKGDTINLSDRETYKKLYYKNVYNKQAIDELINIKKDGEKVFKDGGVKKPLLMFSSNGEKTFLEKNLWVKIQEEECKRLKGKLIKLKSDYYIDNKDYKKIADEIEKFIKSIK